MHRTARFTFTIIMLGCLLLAACSPPLSFRGNELSSPIEATDFTLTDQHGQPFRLSEQQGQVVLLFFGYASCPDVCPTTLGIWKQAYAELGDDAERVRFVFVTVDPERDTQERMKVHLALFNPNFIGLTGTPEELEPVYQVYGVVHEKQPMPDSGLGYQVTHTASAYLIDADGYWRVRHLFGTPAEDLAHDIRQLLQ
ncbi:MAG: SCO family protein [Chloroflexi bacterium]|nr:SCO family protein [Chloroflexota bacterium]